MKSIFYDYTDAELHAFIAKSRTKVFRAEALAEIRYRIDTKLSVLLNGWSPDEPH